MTLPIAVVDVMKNTWKSLFMRTRALAPEGTVHLHHFGGAFDRGHDEVTLDHVDLAA